MTPNTSTTGRVRWAEYQAGANGPAMPAASRAAVAAAEREFVRRFPPADLPRYTVEVLRDGDAVVVLFTHEEIPPGTFGAVPGKPGFEVTLDPDTLAVRQAHFSR
jgi:hypothetical protein